MHQIKAEPIQETASCETSQIAEEAFMTYSTFLSIRHIEAGGVGYKRGYTTVEGLFFPLRANDCIWTFVDIRLHRFTNNEYAANAGLGVRFQPPCHDNIYGLNVYYDYRSDQSRQFHFNQIGVGFELLNCCYSLRVNGYWPFKERKLVQRCVFDEYIGDFFMIKEEYRGTFRGIDLELGKNFFSCDPCFPLDIYIGVGPYYYQDECDDVWGGRAVLEAWWCSRFFLGFYMSHDKFFKRQIQGQIGVTLPFGGCCESTCNSQLRTLPVRRNEIIYLDKYCKWETNF